MPVQRNTSVGSAALGFRPLRSKEMSELLGVNERTIIRWEAAGLLPASRLLGKRQRVWLSNEVEEFLQALPKSGKMALEEVEKP